MFFLQYFLFNSYFTFLINDNLPPTSEIGISINYKNLVEIVTKSEVVAKITSVSTELL